MTTTSDDAALRLRQALTETALVLAGAFHRYGASDALMEAVGEALADTFRDALDGEHVPKSPCPRLHPAMAALLDLLDDGAAR
jgi:hypothetical protein